MRGGHKGRLHMGDQRYTRGPEFRVLRSTGNFMAELVREFTMHDGDIDADLLEHPALHDADLTAAALGPCPWSTGEYAGRGIAAGQLGLDFLKFGAYAIAQVT